MIFLLFGIAPRLGAENPKESKAQVKGSRFSWFKMGVAIYHLPSESIICG